MKKVLSFVFVAGFVASAFSQSLWSDNFESYNTGNLGSQGDWDRDSGVSPNWTKVANIDGAHGKSLQLASTVENTDGDWEFHDSNWSNKSDGNNIFVVEYDYYTGAAGDGVGIMQIYDVDAGYEEPFEIGWDPSEGYIYVADQDGGEILDDAPAENTWYHIKAAYDQNTGEVKVQLNNNEPVSYAGIPGWEPTEFDVLIYSITTAGFDNITTSATNTDPFMAVSDVAGKSKLLVYPNPTTDVINIASDKKVSNIAIYDASGKVIKTTAETTINVQNFAKGSYVLSIKYADGSTESKKVIKK